MSEKKEKAPKRFSAQPDGLFNLYEARRRAVQEGIKQLRADFPFITGAVLDGSLARGKSHYKSDVDVYVFFDAAQVAKELGIRLEEILRDVPLERQGKPTSIDDMTPYEKFLLGLAHTGSAYICSNVSRLRMPTEPQVMPVATGKEVIDDALRALNFAQNLPAIQHPGTAMMRLVRLFHISVTQGVFADREYLLQGLKSKGAIGEFIWSKIIELVAQGERFDKHGFYTDPLQMPLPQHIKYPWTLEEALKKYASHNIKK